MKAIIEGIEVECTVQEFRELTKSGEPTESYEEPSKSEFFKDVEEAFERNGDALQYVKEKRIFLKLLKKKVS